MKKQLLAFVETNMDDPERTAMRDHIVWLTQQLELARLQNRERTALLKRMLDPEDLGFAVSNEVKSLVYQLLISDLEAERNAWNR
jgi:hypothetical protein